MINDTLVAQSMSEAHTQAALREAHDAKLIREAKRAMKGGHSSQGAQGWRRIVALGRTQNKSARRLPETIVG